MTYDHLKACFFAQLIIISAFAIAWFVCCFSDCQAAQMKGSYASMDFPNTLQLRVRTPSFILFPFVFVFHSASTCHFIFANNIAYLFIV